MSLIFSGVSVLCLLCIWHIIFVACIFILSQFPTYSFRLDVLVHAMSHTTRGNPAKETVSKNPPIANDINAATRTLHVELNKLIADRLPLGLPPHAPSPARYAAGLHRFATLYFAFEHAFNLVSEHADKEHAAEHPSNHRREVMRWVAQLVPPTLQRTPRLKADLEHLQSCGYNASTASYGEAKLDKLMSDAVEKPHILVAYAWVMYMAIFSGGRWIRQQLSKAGPAFWFGIDEAAGLRIDDLPGFTFLSFDKEDDGEELKAIFKAHLLAAEDLLTAEERQEVVATGVDVFEQCIQLVEQIDRDLWWLEGATSWPLAVAVLATGLCYIGYLFYSGQSLLLD